MSKVNNNRKTKIAEAEPLTKGCPPAFPNSTEHACSVCRKAFWSAFKGTKMICTPCRTKKAVVNDAKEPIASGPNPVNAPRVVKAAAKPAAAKTKKILPSPKAGAGTTAKLAVGESKETNTTKTSTMAATNSVVKVPEAWDEEEQPQLVTVRMSVPNVAAKKPQVPTKKTDGREVNQARNANLFVHDPKPVVTQEPSLVDVPEPPVNAKAVTFGAYPKPETPSMTPLQVAYSVGLEDSGMVRTNQMTKILARVDRPDGLNESAIDFTVYERCRSWTPLDFDVNELSFVSRRRQPDKLSSICINEPWVALPRLPLHSHPVLHDHREKLLLQFYLSGCTAIYDLGGSSHRWLHVLNIVNRLNLLGARFPIRKIHINSPSCVAPFAPSPLFGSLEDAKYWGRNGHMRTLHPDVFTYCGCVWGIDVCPHHEGAEIITVDSIYYVMEHLPVDKDIHVIAHEYHIPSGALGETVSEAEMTWEWKGQDVSVVIGESASCTYQHRNLRTSCGYVKNDHDEFWSVDTKLSYSPWGSAHEMKYSVWTPVIAMPPLGARVREMTFTLTTEMRTGTSALAATTQREVTVVDTGKMFICVPSAALNTLSNRFPGTAREQDVHTAAGNMVNQCSAIDTRMSVVAIEFLVTQHGTRHIDRRNAVWGNRTLLAIQFWWNALASILIFLVVAAWYEAEHIGTWWTLTTLGALYILHLNVVLVTTDVDSARRIDAPGSREDVYLGVTRREYGLAPARYLYSKYMAFRFYLHLMRWYPGQILDNFSRASKDMGNYPLQKHTETTTAWLAACCVSTGNGFLACFEACGGAITWCCSKLPGRRDNGYQQLPQQYLPASLLTALANHGWIYDPFRYLAGYVCIVGGDDVSSVVKNSITREHKDVGATLGYPLTGTDTSASFGHPAHGTFFSTVPVPMVDVTTDERVFVSVPNFGRFLSRSHFSAKRIHEKYVPGRVLDNVKCYRTYFGTVPVFKPLLDMWERVTKAKTSQPKFRHTARSETVSAMYRFVEKPNTHNIQPDYATYQWIADHYDNKFTVEDLYDFERVIENCPGDDYVITHHVATIMIETDTEYSVPCTKTVTYLPIVSAIFEDTTAIAFRCMTGYTGAIVNILIGLIEMALMGGNLFPLVAHVIQAVVVWYAGSTIGLFAHLAWNYQWVFPSTGRYAKVTREQLDACRVCAPNYPFPDPAKRDPTFQMQVKVGTKLIYSVPAIMKYKLEKQPDQYCGQNVWLTKKEEIPLRKRQPEFGTFEDVAKYPCNSRTHTAPGAQWLVSSCFANPCVLSGCMRNTVLGAVHRRAKPSPHVPRKLEKAWIKHLLEQSVPLLLVLDAAEELKWEPRQQFEWWLNRPGFATEARKVQLRKAFEEIQNGESIKFNEAKTFCKIQMECSSASPMNEFLPVYEPDSEKGPRSRGVTCVSDHVAVLRGPITQLVAKILGRCFEPGVYKTLPGCIHKTETVWMKGCDPVTMGNLINSLFSQAIYCDGTDASAFDKNHTMATRRAVDLAWRYYPQSTKDILANIQYVSKTRMNTDTGVMSLVYTQQGGMLSGEPDTSLTNTLVRMAIDRIMHSVAKTDVASAQAWAKAQKQK